MNATLAATSKSAGFSGTFTEVPHQYSLGLRNAEQLRLFHLAVQNNKFSHTDLVKFLRKNIGRYVFSRADIAAYERDDNLEQVALDAVVQIEGQAGAQGLGELLLYIVLEQILKAPKVLSKIELNRRCGQVRSQCDAIHLLTPDGSQPASSLVFGTSSIVGDMQDAIDAAFDKIREINTNSAVECQLAEEQVFAKEFDPASAQTIRDILIPQPGVTPIYDSAYGIFLAYDLGLDPTNYSNSQYRAELDKKMDLDLRQHAAYIAHKINSLNLTTHSFYVYVLPFDNSDTDCESIMRAVLSRGGQ